ncbi:MAG TPA: heme o synthase [Candidatus Dormibacteraeota bacterium]|nr:heme o synthase [Candidatus Dormibacteraeota bacterium]
MSSTLARVDGLKSQPLHGLLGTLCAYLDLVKPRIIVLLLVTTLAAMLMAAHGFPPAHVLLWTLLGGALASASAGTLNCIYDADIDKLMRRTENRPIPTGRIGIRAATIYAVTLGALSFAILILFVNPLAAWLSLAGSVYYVGIYTMWLKRRTPLNIVVGGAAGSIPPLVGWAAVTGSLGPAAFALFGLIFLWTPPHFWALALMTETDYDKAGVPMLPNVVGEERTKIEIVVYSAVLVVGSLALYPLHVFGAAYEIAAAILGALFLFYAIGTMRDRTTSFARELFRYSLVYLALMSLAMVVDRVILR